MSLLQEKLQRKRVELGKKSVETQFLRRERDSANLQAKIERGRADMISRQLAAEATSHAVHMKEVQMQLASLKENKERNDQMIQQLQRSVQQKEEELQEQYLQVALKESQLTHTPSSVEFQPTERTSTLLELEDMKMNVIDFKEELECVRTAAKLLQEEASYYQQRTESLLRATKLTLKWRVQKKAPVTMIRGVAVVQSTTIYIIGRDSQTVYSYRLDKDKWKTHSLCPHTNPGLVIINNLLTAVGGENENRHTNMLLSWNRTKWVEMFPPMQTPRKDPAVVYDGNYIIAVGGDHEERGVELLHIPSLCWTTAMSLPCPLANITATLCHGSVVAMDDLGSAFTISIASLISSIQLEESSAEHSRWIPLSRCPVVYYSGPTLTTFSGQAVVVSHNGIIQLQEKEWVKIGEMSVPMWYSIVCVVCDQMVVVGGQNPVSLTFTDIVRVASVAL